MAGGDAAEAARRRDARIERQQQQANQPPKPQADVPDVDSSNRSNQSNNKTYVVNGQTLTKKQFESLRRKAVRDAWKQEKELVKNTGQGSRDWTAAEKQELLTKGKVTGYEGQHMKSAEAHPDYAGDPNNIQFLKGRNMDVNEHLAAHGGDYKNPTNGYYDPKTGNFVDFDD